MYLTWTSGLPLLQRLQTQADGVRVLIYNGDEDPGISSFLTQVRKTGPAEARRASPLFCTAACRTGHSGSSFQSPRRGARGPLASTRRSSPARRLSSGRAWLGACGAPGRLQALQRVAHDAQLHHERLVACQCPCAPLCWWTQWGSRSRRCPEAAEVATSGCPCMYCAIM